MDKISQVETMLTYAIAGENNERDFSEQTDLYIKEDQGKFLEFNPLQPRSMYASALDDDALFTVDANYLIHHPIVLLGNKTEVVLQTDNGIMKWVCLRYIGTKLPKGISCLGSPRKIAALYEFHYREFYINGTQRYNKRLVALTVKGNFIPLYVHGTHEICSRREYASTIIACSVKEQAFRVNTVLATFFENNEIRIPISYEGYQDVFRIRDNPIHPSGKKKAILHSVAKHSRQLGSGKLTEVKAHQRGIDFFTIDGLDIELEINEPESLSNVLSL